MKPFRPFVFAILLILVVTAISDARIVQRWSEQELLDKSDLVVIATPTEVRDTKERMGLPGFESQPVMGVETTFVISAVLKGDKATKAVILYHYRPDKMEVPNAPTFVAFDPKEKRTFRLHLVRLADGRYGPVAGQIDPDMSILDLPHSP